MEAVSVSTGVVRSLPSKLEQVLELLLRKGEKTKISILKDQIQELIDKYLMEPSEVETPAETARCWVKEVRELSYDIDDFLHELVHGHLTASKNLQRRSRWVSDNCLQFGARLRDAIKRHKTYNLDRCKKWPINFASEQHPFPSLYGLATARLVGIDRSMEKLEEWLTGDAERGLRVVSIVGLGGVGKTTLAKELYHKVESQFECRAFARTSRKPDIRKLLYSILLQVRPAGRPPDASGCDDHLIDTIRAHLEHKKYFIIIDDLWDSSSWDIVYRALPDDKCCSRVVTTTEIDNVAQRCCGHNLEYILKMGPLGDDESQELFFSRFPHDRSDICEQSEVFCEIIRKCGGFPLATVALSSLLARQYSGIEQFNYKRIPLSSNLRRNPSIEGMKQVIDICYNSLPGRLKTCLLYLGKIKEDYIIWKDDLVKQWIAEGFISAKEGNSIEEVANTYVDELINGCMIQPVDITYNGEVLSCTVHYLILDLIRYKSREDNFFTAIDGSQTNIRLADKVRRLSLLFDNADNAAPPANLRLSQIRSLVFNGLINSLPRIVDFRHLRVLVLHIWGNEDIINFDMTTLSKLFGLKYLEIVCNVTLSLETEMQGLRCLETLKIDSRLSEVPHDIVDLLGLLHLSLPSDTNLPNGIGRLATLRTLGCFDLTRNSADNVLSLSELTNVWELRLACSELQPDNLKRNMEHLASVLSLLRNLKSLTMLPAGSYNESTTEESASIRSGIFFNFYVLSPPTLLEKLELIPRTCILYALPEWIGELRRLSILKIEVKTVSASDINILRELPALAALSLYVQNAPDKRIIFHKEGFPVLMQFVFMCSALCVAFEEGAMPNVRELKVGFNGNTIRKYSISQAGFENLAGLEVFSGKIGGTRGDDFCGKAVQSAMADIFGQNLIINIQFVGWVFYGYKEISTTSATQEIAEENWTEDTITSSPWDASFSYDAEISTVSELRHRHRRWSPLAPSTADPDRWHPPSPPPRRSDSLLSGCGVWARMGKATEGRDRLFWWHGLARRHGGHVSIAVTASSILREDQCCLLESSYLLGTLMGFLVVPRNAGFALDHLFANLRKSSSSSAKGMTEGDMRRAFLDPEEGLLLNIPYILSVIVGVVQGGTLLAANLGNSRAVLGKKMHSTGEIAAEKLCHDHHTFLEERLMDGYPYDFYASLSVISRKLHPDDRFVILTSEGLWEHLSNQEAVDIVHNHQPAGSAKRLVKAALQAAAAKHELRYSDLKKIHKDVRRDIHDDITAIVLFISDGGQLVPSRNLLSIRYPRS